MFGINPKTSRQKIADELKEFHPSSVVLIKLGTTTNEQIAEVEFDNLENAQDADKEMNLKEIDGSVIHAFVDRNILEYQRQAPQIIHSHSSSPSLGQQLSLVIMNLSNNTQEQNIRDLLGRIQASSISILQDKNSFEGLRMAIVEFDNPESALQALKLIDKSFMRGNILHAELFQADTEIEKYNQDQSDNIRPNIHETNKLRISNLPQNITSEQLKNVFKEFGEVECDVVQDKRARTGPNIGFATFTTPTQAAKARNALNGRNIFGEDREMRIFFARTQEDENAKLHISQLPPNITPQKLRQLFEKYGVKDIQIPNQRNINRPGQQYPTFQQGQFAFIVLKDEKEIENAIREMNNMNLEGWRINVEKQMSQEEIVLKREQNGQQQENINQIDNLQNKYNKARQKADYKRQQANQQRQYIQTKGVDVQIYEAGKNACEVFAAGFPTTQTDASLLQMFSSFGAVKASMAKDKITQRTKEFGFVTFLRQDQAINAVNSLNGSMNSGKKMKVTLSRDNKIQDKLQYIGKLLNEERQKIAEAERAEAEATSAEKELKDARLKIGVQGPSID
ncbi:MAG: putative RNA binding protein, partial [Streblomastix strix]